MTAWGRVQRLELELAQAQARIKALEGEIRETRIAAGLEHFDGTTTHDRVRVAVRRLVEVEAERDRAREVAVALEQENAELVTLVDDLYETAFGDDDLDDEALAELLARFDIRARRGDA